ncbi:DUF3784 domain-containing protein [Larkinella humicola]|uniref:DUF3784 domain-containing protein n=1 Tax=Larkinella humicola TaxID=2607654 RepID=A0A5N1JD89_9BACT|nr:DUF3784 domain-containing protein [Larkinella humicola]KAA9349036.1 DUF3784 domain-containing protein [Larkinella humicola]
MFSFVFFALIGVFFLFLGFMIWKFKIANVIAGYDENTIKDPDGLARWVGKCMMVTGVGAWVLGVIAYFYSSEKNEIVLYLIFMISTLMSGIATLAGSQKFYK